MGQMSGRHFFSVFSRMLICPAASILVAAISINTAGNWPSGEIPRNRAGIFQGIPVPEKKYISFDDRPLMVDFDYLFVVEMAGEIRCCFTSDERILSIAQVRCD
ncbi:hypothetical protein [Burkholderia gladioli]|uniref:hypothetical protein n=1 Tax=Burkholderia gladioli TaxID=28095 RepID=UPI0016403A67|nr:hypothetical protein [Burkholderia gladioli]